VRDSCAISWCADKRARGVVCGPVHDGQCARGYAREGLCRRPAPGEDLGGSFDEASDQRDGFDRPIRGPVR
jgi:hypothetical protein